MNAFGKVSVVFVATASLVFAAFVFALLSGGPNWRAERDRLTGDYLFEEATGATTTYAVKDRVTGTSIASSPVLAEVVVAARQKQVSNLRAELQTTTEVASRLKPLLEPIRAQIEVDRKGIAARRGQLEQLREGLATQLEQASTRLVALTTDLQQTRLAEQERREEGLRLKNIVEMLRNDLFAAAEQHQALQDELIRLEQTRLRLRARNEQLQQQVTY